MSYWCNMEVFAVTVFRADNCSLKTIQLYKSKLKAENHAKRLNEMYEQDDLQKVTATVEIMTVR